MKREPGAGRSALVLPLPEVAAWKKGLNGAVGLPLPAGDGSSTGAGGIGAGAKAGAAATGGDAGVTRGSDSLRKLAKGLGGSSVVGAGALAFSSSSMGGAGAGTAAAAGAGAWTPPKKAGRGGTVSTDGCRVDGPVPKAVKGFTAGLAAGVSAVNGVACEFDVSAGDGAKG